MSEVKPTVRLDYLDSLRGIAAMMVLLYHYMNWFWKDELWAKIGSLLWNGADAVSFFFVLSGLVLSYKYFNLDGKMHFGKYLFKRVFRLYPAYLITIAICLIYWFLAPSLDEIVQRVLHLNYGSVWAEMSMVMNKHQFYIPGWTLSVEMIYSLVIPILIFIARWEKKLIWLLLIGSLVFHPTYNSIFLFHFILGLLLAVYFEQIQALNWRETKLFRFRFILVPLIFIFYNLRHITRIWEFPNSFSSFLEWTLLDDFHFSALSTAGIILIVIMSKNWQEALQHKWLKYLGKISYGIYLMHWVFVVAVMEHYEILINWVPLPEWCVFLIFLICTILVTLITAHWLYQYVEAPIIKWAKRKVSIF